MKNRLLPRLFFIFWDKKLGAVGPFAPSFHSYSPSTGGQRGFGRSADFVFISESIGLFFPENSLLGIDMLIGVREQGCDEFLRELLLEIHSIYAFNSKLLGIDDDLIG